VPLRHTAWVARILMGSCVLHAGMAVAAEPPTVAELQAEIAKLRQENAALKQANKDGGKAPIESVVNAPTPDPAVIQSSPPAARSDNTTLDDVVVKSKRSTPLAVLKDVPQSVSVVSGDELEKQQVSNFRDVIKRIGNIKWGGSSTNPTTTALSLRGVGYLGSGGALGFDASINTTVDGVPYILSNMAVFNSYYDIDTVDVARGPQGASGGYSASLGKITFKTKAPSFTPEAEGSITYGQNKTLITRGVIGGPVIDGLLAWRGTFFREQADGNVKNNYYSSQTAGGNEVAYNNIDRSYGRVQFLLTPSATFNARLSADVTPTSREYGISSNGGILPRPVPDFYDATGANGQRIAVDQSLQDTGRLTRRWFTQDSNFTYGGTYLRDANRSEHYPIANDTRGASAQLNWKLNDYTLSAITAWRDYHFDFGSPNFSNPTPFDILRGPSSGLGYFRQATQELRIESPTDGTVSYQAGLFYARVAKSSGGDGRGNKYGSDAGAYYATPDQYNLLDSTAAGRYLLANSLDRLSTNSYAAKKDTSTALYGSLNWKLTERLVTNFGLRLSQEERRNDTNYNHIYDQGFAPELNPVSVNNVALGGFNSTTKGGVYGGLIGSGSASNIGYLNTNDPKQVALADATAKKYFGVDHYSDLTGEQARTLANAKLIRLSRLTGSSNGLYNEVAAEPFSKLLYSANISPSYKFNEQQTGYFSWQHGEKAGISQIVGATVDGGVSVPVKPEKNDSYELGLRSAFFDKALVVNTTLFYQNIRDYISNLYFFDAAQTAASGVATYTTGVGNVPKVRSKGIELDVAYAHRNTNVRWSGAYNDARYVKFPNAGKPAELAVTGQPAYFDVSGRRLPGVGPFTYNLFVEQVWPVSGGNKLFANVNYNYTSSYLTDPALSRYSRVDSYGLTDLGLGFATPNRAFEVSLLVKNAFNVDYGYQPVWNLYIPSAPRWFGVTVGSKFY